MNLLDYEVITPTACVCCGLVQESEVCSKRCEKTMNIQDTTKRSMEITRRQDRIYLYYGKSKVERPVCILCIYNPQQLCLKHKMVIFDREKR
jgi:hypothetical protein